ncbi:hypothetical protein BGZ97_008880 [Linnemannia gamsii]|uniref:HCP-like protein n=1 Tax=Linnemannia gamsii TaxID=64522 RepID=A0A9P6RCT3_9FUNG|nr:hypothetical protein BGZ97_008880 [Linnemannia gamsii]
MRGLFHYNGNYVPKDSNVAAEWFQKAAKQNHAESQIFLEMMYLVGEDIPQDYYRALQWLLPLVMEGCPFAQYHVGSMCETDKGLFSKDYSKGMEWYLKSADQGDKDSQVHIGFLYFDGHGVHKDDEIALKWFLKTIKQGCSTGQFLVGMCYEKGQDIEDFAMAMEWYLKAAEDRSAVAMFSIGRMYEQGQGVDKDSSKAMKWFLKGVEEGYVGAQVSSPGCTGARRRASKKLITAKQRNGIRRRAVEWYKNAVDQDSDEARVALAWMYKDGRGVHQSLPRARDLCQELVNRSHGGAIYSYESVGHLIKEEEEEREAYRNHYY